MSNHGPTQSPQHTRVRWSTHAEQMLPVGGRCGELVVVSGGQADASSDRQIAHGSNLETQTTAAIEAVRRGLEEFGANLRDLTKLVVYYVNGGDVDQDAYRRHLGRCLGPDITTTLTMVAVPSLLSPGQRVVMDAYAMTTASGEPLARAEIVLPSLEVQGERFCHGLACGDVVFLSGLSARGPSGAVLHPGDLVSQNTYVLESVSAVLEAGGCTADDVVKLNTWRAPAKQSNDFVSAAAERFAFFGCAAPTATGIPVPWHWPSGNLMLMDVWAMRSRDGGALPIERAKPSTHWDWATPVPYSHGLKCGDLVFVGGQASLDRECNVLHPGDADSQTQVAMRYVESVLMELGASMADVRRLNVHFKGQGRADQVAANIVTRNGKFARDAPACTVVSVAELAYGGMCIEIDAIAYMGPSSQTARSY